MGENETTKGTFIFDEASAVSVIAEYQAHGIDLMIDYDHASLASVTLDPSLSARAAGWFQLEVRRDGLYAANVRWTPPAAAALSAKEFRFMSPAFTAEDGHITSLLNVAITNLPATRRLQPLMAASKGNGMTLEEFMKVCKALGLDMTMSLDDAMAKIKGEGPADVEDAPPPAGDGGSDEATETAAAPPPPPADDKKKDAAVAASVGRLMSLTGAQDFVSAVDTVAAFRLSHLELEVGRTKLAAERAVLESAERRKLCIDLVACGAEFPSTVWADDKATTLKPRWLKMDLTELRSHAADQKAARGDKKVVSVPAGNTAAGASHGLSADEQAICASTKCDPAVFAALKLTRDSAKAGG